MNSLVIGSDTVVTVSYVLFDKSGEAVDSASAAEPLQYVHGYAQIVPGLERGLTGMHVGEKRSFEVPPDEAFGEVDDEAIFEVDKTDFPDAGDVSKGDEFVAEGADGESISVRVVDILDETFLVDANHPLAGQTLRFEVEVTDVRPATEEEIAEAQAELEEMIDDADTCCGGDHDHEHHDHTHHHAPTEAPPLVQLSKKA